MTDRCSIFAVGKHGEHIAHLAKPPMEEFRISLRQLSYCRDPVSVQLSLCSAANIEKVFDRLRPDDVSVILLVNDCDGVRLFVIGAKLGKYLIPADSNTDCDAQLEFDPVADFFRNQLSVAFTGSAASNIKPALIYAEGFLLVCVIRIDFMSQTREAQVQIHVGRHEDDVGTYLPCLP